MDSIELDIQFSTVSIKWLDTIVDMKHILMYNHIKQDITDIGIQANNRDIMSAWRSYQKDILFDDIDDFNSLLDEFEEFESYSNEIAGRKYQAVSTDEVIAQLDHLTGGQKKLLKEVLYKHTVLFDGKLGGYTSDKVHLELINNFKPSWMRAYQVPFTKEKAYKDELDAMVKEGSIEKCHEISEWAAPSFIIPDQDGTVRFINDFRELNKMLKRKSYKLPRIQDIMNKKKSYTYCTKIDLSMFFHCLMLDDASKELCTINTPFGLYCFNQLPQGPKVSPNLAQAVIEKILQDINTNAYMDDACLFTDNDFEHNVQLIDKLSTALAKAGMKCNPLKCAWAVQETSFLGHWMLPTAVKPLKKAILKMDCPRNQTQVRSNKQTHWFIKN